MTSIRKLFFVAAAAILGAFALPSWAAPAKIFGLFVSPSTVSTASNTFTATYSNQTPNGNSVINTVILTPPAGVTNVTVSFPSGGGQVACPATTVNSSGQTVPVPAGSVCVANIPSVMKAGCTPTACSWSFKVSATLPNACTVYNWTGQAFAGNSFNGDVFALVSAGTSLSTTYGACSVTASSSDTSKGTVNAPTSVAVAQGSTASFTVTPTTGYHAVAATGSCPAGTLVGNTYTTGTITGACNLIANFAINTYTITASAGANGSINPVGSVGASYGDKPTFTVTPSTGYHIASVGGTCGPTLSSGDGVGTSNYQTAPITGDCSVTASFAINVYALTASVVGGTGGTISPTSANVNYNLTQAFTVTPDTANNYSIASVTGCGVTLTSGDGKFQQSTYTTAAVTAACNVAASFTKDTLTILSAPTSAALNTQFQVTVGINPPGSVAGGGVTADTSGCGGASWTLDPSSTTSLAVFDITIPKTYTGATCAITFNATNYASIPLSPALPVFKGVLDCGGYDSSLGSSDPSLDPDLDKAYILDGSYGWGLRRGPNKDGSACVLVNYSCDMTAAPGQIATCTWDKSTPNKAGTGTEQATFKYVFVWSAVDAASTGWASDFHPWVTWKPNPSASPGWPDWMPGLACVNDMFPTTTGSLPTWALPIIPNALPYSDLTTNTYGPYHPFVPPGTTSGTPQLAMVCVAQQGSTSVGTMDGSNSSRPIKLQWWTKVIDEADVRVSGP